MDQRVQALEFIRNQRASGVNDPEIRQALLQRGWPEAEVNSLFQADANGPMVNPALAPNPYPLQKAPWSLASLYVVGFLFGPLAGYLVVMENLKRIGENEKAEKLKVNGAIIILLILLAAIFLTKFIPSGVSIVVGILFPLLYNEPFKKWQQEHPGIAKFQADILLKGLLGLILTFAVLFAIGMVLAIVGVIPTTEP